MLLYPFIAITATTWLALFLLGKISDSNASQIHKGLGNFILIALLILLLIVSFVTWLIPWPLITGFILYEALATVSTRQSIIKLIVGTRKLSRKIKKEVATFKEDVNKADIEGD